MTPTAGSAVFLDTNILVYASFAGTPFHTAARARLSELETNGTILWTSRQVLREFLAVTTRSGNILPAPVAAALSQLVRQFEAGFQIADEDGTVTAHLLRLLESRTIQGKQIHDANAVATMQRYGIRYLLTHNTTDFEKYSPDIVLLPLL